MELWDVLDGQARRTGRTITRGQRLATGDFHLVVHIWIRNEHGKYLIQKRADHLEWQPGIWAATGGSVIAGEDSLSGALRETREELGLDLHAAELSKLARLLRVDSIVDLWLAQASTDRLGTPMLGPEVTEIRWVPKSELQRMADVGDFYAYSYLDTLPD